MAFFRSAHWILMLLLAAVVSPAIAREGQPPHVLVILADDAGWGDFSFVGNGKLATPAIDAVAREGAIFERFYVQPVCAPTRAEFLTGRYHPRSGVRGVTLGQERMDPGEQTIAEVFRSAGYATGCFGKWHNGTQWPYHPRARGFEAFYGFTEGHWGSYFNPPMEQDGRFVRGKGYIADDITDHAIDFLKRRLSGPDAKPTFCYVAFNTPHSPMCVPEADWQRFRDKPLEARGPDPAAEELPFTRAALAMVENLDRNVGRLLDTLREANADQDTIVVFFSDNGPNSGRWCGGMRGRKGSTDEGGVRSVCCLRYPAAVRSGTRVPEISGAIDLLPTLTGLAGIVTKPARPLDGLNLAALLQQDGQAAEKLRKPAAERMIFASFNGKVSVRTDRHRLDAQGHLYDMKADPGQTRDLAGTSPEIAASLRAAVELWRKDVLNAVPSPQEERFPVGASGSPHTELPARDGRAEGGILRSAKAPNASFFTNWKTAQDALAWDVDVLSPGNYTAELWYTCAMGDAGAAVEMLCGNSAMHAVITPAWDPPLNHGEDRVARRGEGYEKDFHPLVLGTIPLPAGRQTLRLRATNIPGQSVADVRRLVLRRVGP